MRGLVYVNGSEGVGLAIDRFADDESDSPVERYHRFFVGAPLYGGREWALSVTEIVKIFADAIEVSYSAWSHRRAEALAEFREQVWPVRIWQRKFGWRLPAHVSRKELVEEMTSRCKDLAEWMESAQHRPFYASSDMSRFIG